MAEILELIEPRTPNANIFHDKTSTAAPPSVRSSCDRQPGGDAEVRGLSRPSPESKRLRSKLKLTLTGLPPESRSMVKVDDRRSRRR